MAKTVSLDTLRATLAERFPDAVPVGYATLGACPTGVLPLDEGLPGGGLPRGRLHAWDGPGGTAIGLGACALALAHSQRAAWVDARGALDPAASPHGLLIVRCEDGVAGYEAAEILMRSGAFAVVVIDAPRPRAGQAARLAHAAREGAAAGLLLASRSGSGLRFVSRIAISARSFEIPGTLPESVQFEVEVLGAGAAGPTRFALPLPAYDVRLSPDAGLRDRRGAA